MFLVIEFFTACGENWIETGWFAFSGFCRLTSLNVATYISATPGATAALRRFTSGSPGFHTRRGFAPRFRPRVKLRRLVSGFRPFD